MRLSRSSTARPFSSPPTSSTRAPEARTPCATWPTALRTWPSPEPVSTRSSTGRMASKAPTTTSTPSCSRRTAAPARRPRPATPASSFLAGSFRRPAPVVNPAPFGVTFTGRAFSEPTLIALAYAFEQATKHRQPPASAPPLATDSFVGRRVAIQQSPIYTPPYKTRSRVNRPASVSKARKLFAQIERSAISGAVRGASAT